MLLRNEAKVGTLIFVAILAVIATYWFLRGFGLGQATYRTYAIFNDVRKLDRQSDVRMAGVKVGFVESIKLTRESRARVDMVIWKDVCIPANSIARITTGGFIGDNYVDVLAGSDYKKCLGPGSRMRSQEPMNYDKLVENVGSLVDELKVAVGSINSVVSDKKLVANFKNAVAELNEAATAAAGVVQSAQGLVNSASPEVRRALANMTAATQNATQITRHLDEMVQSDIRPDAKALISQASEAMKNLSDATAEAKEIVKAVGGSTGKIDETLTKIANSAQQLDEMMANFNEASKGIRDIATDQQLKANIKATMQNAADASAEAKALLGNINRKLSKYVGGGSGRGTESYRIPDKGISTNALWNTTEGDYRFDANYTFDGLFGGTGRDFYRVGAFNVGETTRANIQGGHMLSNSTAMRYGIYASRVGIGMDQWVGRNFLLSGDVLRPNDPQYDLRGVFRLDNGFGIYGGVSNILGGTDVFTGISYNK